MKEALKSHRFDVVYDLNGREAVETKIILDAVPGTGAPSPGALPSVTAAPTHARSQRRPPLLR